jgi:hypothetical protein
MSKDIPVVFFHIGDHDYFKSALRIALKKNQVIHIGSGSQSSDPNYEFVNLSDVSEWFSKFSTLYKHLSFNDFNYERVCFLRWFSLMNLMKLKNLNNCFHADSDVAILDNMVDAFNELGQPETSYALFDFQENYRWTASGHCSYWSLPSITKFCNFMIECYSSKERMEKLNEKFNYHLTNSIPGGICDMTLLYLFSLENKIKALNFESKKSVFDQNINDSENFYKDEFVMIDCKKKLIKENQTFYGETKDGKKIRFKAVHFQGNSKHFLIELENLILKNS